MSVITSSPFSVAPIYQELNRDFIHSLSQHLTTCACVVDLACGSGSLTGMLLREVAALRAQRPILAIQLDLSRRALEMGRAYFAEQGVAIWPEKRAQPRAGIEANAQMIFVEASGDTMPVGDDTADIVLLGNAIHCFTDKGKLLGEVGRILHPGGIFAFNTAFFTGTMASGTEQFYMEWVKQALQILKEDAAEASAQSSAGQTRPRSRTRTHSGQRAFSNRWLSPAEYCAALQEHGFEVINMAERTVEMLPHHFEGMVTPDGSWENDLAAALLSGYPLARASEALQKGVEPAFAATGLESMGRKWLELIAVKR